MIAPLLLLLGAAQPTDAALYARHDWFALGDRIAAGAVMPPLYRGAVAVAQGDDAAARKLLTPLLADPAVADDARTWLSYVALRRGRYREAARTMGGPAGNPLATSLTQLADQRTIAWRRSTIRYRIFQHKLFVPLAVNGRNSEFIVDSDANFSFVSESEARRLGLVVVRSTATTSGALGAQSRLDIAAAPVTIGVVRLTNVAFMVLPDDASLFATLAPGQRGAIGLPVLLALRSFGWDDHGVFTIGTDGDGKARAAPLGFDGADPIVRFGYGSDRLPGVFDLGAETTDLWPPFAARYRDWLVRAGTPGTKTVHGFGGNGEVPDITVPAMTVRYGDTALALRPGRVLTARTTANSGWLFGRMGLDLLRDARSVTVDFDKMRLAVTPARPR